MMLTPVLSDAPSGNLRIWEHPTDRDEYVVGIDTAEGRVRDKGTMRRKVAVSYSDARPDYSAAVVVEKQSGIHVATWHGYIQPDQWATICAAIGWYYNTALLVPELNGPGLAVVTKLSETLLYPNIYRSRMFNVMDMDPLKPSHGWRTDQHNRKILMLRVHEALASGQQITKCSSMLSELRTMEFDDQGVERGRGKNKDDQVLALALALQGRYESLAGGARDEGSDRPRDYESRVWDVVLEKQQRQAERGNLRSGGVAPRWPSGPRPPRAR